MPVSGAFELNADQYRVLDRYRSHEGQWLPALSKEDAPAISALLARNAIWSEGRVRFIAFDQPTPDNLFDSAEPLYTFNADIGLQLIEQYEQRCQEMADQAAKDKALKKRETRRFWLGLLLPLLFSVLLLLLAPFVDHLLQLFNIKPSQNQPADDLIGFIPQRLMEVVHLVQVGKNGHV